MAESIITAAAVLAAVIAIAGYYNKVYSFVKHQEEQDKRMDAIERDAQSVQKELALIVDGLSACLDGLSQLGANHSVTATKAKLDEHINKRAHRQEV